jgi:hypothetical protein
LTGIIRDPNGRPLRETTAEERMRSMKRNLATYVGLGRLLKAYVTSYLDDSAKPVTLEVDMQSLPDGTNYPAVAVLSLPTSKLAVRIQNTNYQRVAP